MSIISELSKGYTPPLYAEVLKPFPRGILAEKIGITYGFCSNVLTGCRKPGPEVRKKFIKLAAQVQAEMDAVEAGKNQ